jgi:Na+/H+ antiporter NhaC
MLLVLLLLIVLVFAGAGFALHLLWIAAVALLVLWLVGAALGRGESADRHHFYRW